MESLLKDDQLREVQDYCLHRYGVALEAWDHFDLIKRKEGLWLLAKPKLQTKTANAPQLHSFLKKEAEGRGLRILSGKSFPYKVTSAFYQAFFKHITKGVIEGTEQEALSLLKRQTIATDKYRELNKGYYFFLFKGRFIGIALQTQEGLVSQVPKSLTGQLSKNLELCNK